MSALCKCGHSVYSHGLQHCDVCGQSCSFSNTVQSRLLESDRIRKMCAQLAAAEAAEKLQPVVIHPAVERSA